MVFGVMLLIKCIKAEPIRSAVTFGYFNYFYRFSMKKNISLILVAFALLVAGNAMAKGTKKKGGKGVRLIEAFSQKQQAGIPQAPPSIGQHFIVKWDVATYPETFFWSGENGGFLMCNIQKAHKIAAKDAHNFPQGMIYNSAIVNGDDIHKGDTLELIPVTRGKYPIPADIPQKAKNTLFYKTGGGKWLALPVKNIAKKSDLVLQ